MQIYFWVYAAGPYKYIHEEKEQNFAIKTTLSESAKTFLCRRRQAESLGLL